MLSIGGLFSYLFILCILNDLSAVSPLWNEMVDTWESSFSLSTELSSTIYDSFILICLPFCSCFMLIEES